MRCAKHDRSIVLENKMPLEPRVGFCRRGRGRVFHVQETKTEKAREPTVESLVRGSWRPRYQKQSREPVTGGCVKSKTVTKACKVEIIEHTERQRAMLNMTKQKQFK